MVFRIGSCRVKIEFSFFLMLAFAMLTGSDKLYSILLFASLHEIGHLLVLLAFGGVPDTVIIAFYGIGLTHSASLSRPKELLFLCGGLLVNGIAAVFNIERDVNLALFFINALPLYPLDMGRALALYLPYRICRVIAVLIMTALLAAGVVLHNISLLFIVVYIIVFSSKEDLR